ncbi:MAG: hypothetical protein D6767_10735 [Candidatus Hydrogenedentota bacterium]|nr:MAG: hypothetical protein D6767_10735 [Candidatus Hydrogenedentota bacterium]
MESSSNLEEAKKEILHALYDDLNISKALGIFWQNVKQINSHLPNATEKEKKAYAWFLQDTDKVFGLLPQNFNFEDKIPDNVIQLAEERKKAREEKNYHKADELRSKIENLGYKILDKPNGYEIQKK